MSKCDICGEYEMFSGHRCKPLFYCLHKDDHVNGDFHLPLDTFYEEGYKIHASDEEKAAVKFAEAWQSSHDCYLRDMTVLVMPDNGNTISEYIVNQEAVPSFWVDPLYEPTKYEATWEEEG